MYVHFIYPSWRVVLGPPFTHPGGLCQGVCTFSFFSFLFVLSSLGYVLCRLYIRLALLFSSLVYREKKKEQTTLSVLTTGHTAISIVSTRKERISFRDSSTPYFSNCKNKDQFNSHHEGWYDVKCIWQTAKIQILYLALSKIVHSWPSIFENIISSSRHHHYSRNPLTKCTKWLLSKYHWDGSPLNLQELSHTNVLLQNHAPKTKLKDIREGRPSDPNQFLTA